ncbi:MAG: PfkB family carbohydrate kinase [Alphaproteobacteria bacterium]|nr:PfkB family carbohydrate kinase [Alphaproteobacteria bacterium]
MAPGLVRAAIGPRPRTHAVIMCHGVFDVVHPGHLRHMLYAKSKAEILIVSLTRDAHIEKGRFRPHVPQELRALNLAAFEMVDYVIIDENRMPLANIEVIQPDFFAKGYEYVADGVLPKTHEEMSLVQSYGGEMIFTPGDLVYSSSNLLNLAPPSIKYDKLATLLNSENISFDDIRATLADLKGRHVHVVGDTIVDSFTETTVIGGQTKTPTISVRYDNRRDYVGGAAIVAKHLRAAGAEVTFTTVLGDDDLQRFVLADLENAGITTNANIDSTRPTTHKNAIVANGYRLLKIDTLDNRPISMDTLDTLAKTVNDTKTDSVMFSDFRHGIFSRGTIPTLIDAIPNGVFKVADSQVASRWGNITEFHDFDLITPNEREARFSTGDQDSHIRPLASHLYDVARCKTLMLKLGDRGVLTCRDPDHHAVDDAVIIDSFADNVLDPVGAGDALLAYATLSMLVRADAVTATILGSLAAAVECEQDGNIPVTPEDVLAKIATVERQATFS